MSTKEQDAPPQRRKLPQWLDHFNPDDLKVVIRCWVAVWVMALLIFIQPSLNHIGLATFLGLIVLFIVPPAGTVLIYLLAALSLLLGMCLAWCWGLLTMKAAFSLRSDSFTQERLGLLQQQAVARANITGQPPATEATIIVHEGLLLDTRVTVIFYVMGCLFIYALARLRCANPKFTLTQIFGMIVTDIFMEVGPTLPSFNGSLAAILVKPAAIGIGLGTVCCLLLFPKSTSCMVLGLMEKLIRASNGALEITRKRLNDGEVPLAEAKALRAQMIAIMRAAQPQLAFLPIDFSRGLWSADDVLQLQTDVRKVATAGLYLIDFHIGRLRAAEKIKEHNNNKLPNEEKVVGVTADERYTIGQHHRQENESLILALYRPEHEHIRLETQHAMRDSTTTALRVGSEAVLLASDVLHKVNACRWVRKPKPADLEVLIGKLDDMRERLHEAREESIQMATERVLEAYADPYDDNALVKMKSAEDRPMLSSLIIAMVLEERITEFVSEMESLLNHLQKLLVQRKTPRFWLPTRMQYIFRWVRHGSFAAPGSNDAGEGDLNVDKDPDKLFDETEEVWRRLNISRSRKAPSARRNRLSHAISATYNWFTNPNGLYAIRLVVVTIALTLPASFATSADFFYREKGIWAVISAQTAMLVYMSEFTFGLITRTVGTILGGVMGMVAWYIGSGSGPGNPYGMAAITGVMIIPLIWWRLYLPAAFSFAIIMGSATFALVIGFSWDEDHLAQYGLPGKGYVAFWKRVVTVLIGFLAAFLVQLFPKPPSAMTHARKTLAQSIQALSDHYALLVSHWGRSDDSTRALSKVSAQITLEVAEVLLSLDPTIAVVKMEMGMSPFNQQSIRQVQEQCQYINQALGGLLAITADLPIDLQERLSHITGIRDDRTIGDVMAVLGIMEQSLRTGSPLPERLPTPLVRRAVETYNMRGEKYRRTINALVGDRHRRRYCVAVTMYLKLLTSVDDLLLVLKGALGERHIVYQWEDA
ncbi:aromatic acid exporter family member 2 domain-containing protein [Sarocladium implicatum]|nr:aromatic acid exporter family member 2 domain-containing protein [Sarocladium implicatum]